MSWVSLMSPLAVLSLMYHAVRELELQKPVYLRTASYGHFGNPDYTWEKPKKLAF